MDSRSISGLKLSQNFFHEIVKPILSEYIQESSYDAALIGPGSEVVGFDDTVSTDHDWGPRIQIFYLVLCNELGCKFNLWNNSSNIIYYPVDF